MPNSTCWDRITIATSGCRARISPAATQAFVGVRRGHPDVDDRHVRSVFLDLAQQLLPQPAWPATSIPPRAGARRCRRARAGCRPRSRPAWELRGDGRAGADRAADVKSPVERLDTVDEPAQPAPARVVGAADPVVCDLDARGLSRAPDADRGAGGLRVLGDVRERLGCDEVGGELDRLGQPSGGLERERRWGPPSAWRASRARRRARGRARRGGCPRASSRSSASECASSSLAVVTSSCADGSLPMRLWSSRSCRASATSRCWAPSCRLRSSRRRSASPAATIRSREAFSSASRACGLRADARSPARSWPRRGPPRPARGRRRATRRRRARRPRGRRARSASTGALAAGRGQRDRLRRRRRRRRAARLPVARRRARGRRALRQRRLQLPAAHRPEAEEQLGEAAAREPRAQQAGEERRRHGHQRAGGEPRAAAPSASRQRGR